MSDAGGKGGRRAGRTGDTLGDSASTNRSENGLNNLKSRRFWLGEGGRTPSYDADWGTL